MSKPLCTDLFAGLGGWSQGFLAENYEVIGFDNVRHQYGEQRYPAQLVLQDVLTIHGSQFRNAACIAASPPCQEFSYMAMPWSRAKQIARALRGEDEFPEKYEGSRTLAELTALFDACFRIQREASAAAGKHVPMVVENVKGAQPWVGMAKAHYGSFYLWGDVESVGGAVVGSRPRFGETLRTTPRARKFNPDGTEHPQGSWFAVADSCNRGLKLPDNNGPRLWSERDVQRLCDAPLDTECRKGPGGDWFENGRQGQYACAEGIKNNGGSWFAIGSPGQENVGQDQDGRKVAGMNGWDGYGKPGYKPQGFNVTAAQRYRADQTGSKRPDGGDGTWFGSYAEQKERGTISPGRMFGSKSDSRKAASAQIAKIPFPLAQHIARIYKP